MEKNMELLISLAKEREPEEIWHLRLEDYPEFKKTRFYETKRFCIASGVIIKIGYCKYKYVGGDE